MLHILSLLFWLVAIPVGIGLIPACLISADRRSPGFVMLAGYFTMWALFEVVAIPAVLFVKYDNFKVASGIFMAIAILCAALGVWIWYRGWKRGQQNGLNAIKRFGRLTWAERIEWLLFFALLGFQLYKAAAYASFDGDDAYYVVESLIAQQADVMYRILPYTGRPTDLDIRHALAVFPMWVAFVASKSGIHATIVSHSVMPLVLIPLSYLVYFEIGKILFYNKPVLETAGLAAAGEKGASRLSHRENLPVFMVVMCMFQIFGNVSIYTNETFFLTRTWQGKAVAGSLVIPALLWMFLQIYGGAAKRGQGKAGLRQKYTDVGLWFVFVCINMAAGVCSSIAVFLVSILIAVTAFCLAVAERDLKVIFKFGAACIPNVVYVGIYLAVGYGHLL